MPTIDEQINATEEEIRITPYNKASQHHIGKLKAKLAKLKDERIRKGGVGKKSGGFAVKKTGDATIALIGFPSVGKSTLLNKLTSADSRVESFDFTTLDVIPGIMDYRGAKIQILDIPGVISGASFGKGRGREILSVARDANLILILIDAKKREQLSIMEKELHSSGIRLNQQPPQVKIKKISHGGVTIFSSLENPGVSREELRGVLNAQGIFSAEVTIREKITLEKLIDVILENRIYIPSIVAVNKIDLLPSKKLKETPGLPISAKEGINLEKLREEIFKKLNFIRVYLKPPGKKADLEEPLILKKGATMEDLCNKLHRDLKKKFRYARVSGSSVKFKEKRVGLTHQLKDGDVVTIIKSL